MTESKAVCRLSAIEKRYTRRGQTVLGPISLAVGEGELLGIRGPNGAGKSTLLGVMAGVLRPDAGKIDWAPGVRRSIGYVPQELSLYGSLTGLDNLRFWAAACGLPRRIVATRSRWLLERLELSEKGTERVSAYSGGMKRRLHLASALMVMPRLLLLDEPTVGADPHSVSLILDMLRHLRSQGCTMVLIDHQDRELAQVCSRVLTLDHGAVVREEAAP